MSDRKREVALQNAETFRDIASAATVIAESIVEEDDFFGPLGCANLLEALTSLPHDLRADIAEAVSDDAARSMRADVLYLEESA